MSLRISVLFSKLPDSRNGVKARSSRYAIRLKRPADERLDSMMRDVGPLDALFHRPRPSLWEEFCGNPVVFIVQKLYRWWRRALPFDCVSPVTVVCISDTHNHQISVPPGEVLVHAGDLTQSGTHEEIQAALSWLKDQPHDHKIVIAGNHDLLLESASVRGRNAARPEQLEWGDIIYLEDETTTIDCKNGRQLKVYGSPRSPRHGNWAFQYPREQDIWHGKIPLDTDVVTTHSPPAGHLDLGKTGCRYLLEELWRIRPRLHVFGHIHAAYGQELLYYDSLQRVYGRTVQASGGMWNLGRFVFAFSQTLFTPTTKPQTLLVNAAIVGGLRDEKIREPIVVKI